MTKTKKSKTKKKSKEPRKIKVRLIGIGGGGGSIVSKVSKKIKEASFYAIDTDARALKRLSKKVTKVRLGKDITHGLGTGMDFKKGEEVAKNEKEEIDKMIKGQDIIILIGCLGGGFASGAASFLSHRSRKLDKITYGVFTLPFKFEGKKKSKIARRALKEIRNKIDAFSIIPNERIFKIIEKSAPLKEALAVVNDHLAESIQGLLEVIYNTGIINIDFADLKTIFSTRGKLAYLNSVRIKKKDSKEKVFKKVIDSPLYPYSIQGGKGVLFNIAGQKNLSLAQVNKVADAISKKVSRSAKIIFGISKSKKKTITRVNLLVTGCQEAGFLKKSKTKKTKKKSSKKKTSKQTKKKVSKKKVSKKEVEKKPEKKENKKIRKNALQVKEDIKKAEKEIISKEKLWEKPAFLRKK